MKTTGFIVLATITFAMGNEHMSAQNASASQPAHVRNSFQFTVALSVDRAAPLFGPEGERCWAGEHWNPEFLHPIPAKDIEGAVFTIPHGAHKSVWVNTLFDLSSGRMQYVSFVPEMLVSTIDVRLTAINPVTTGVEVTYTRTALSSSANDDVAALGESDRANGPHWKKAIEGCAKK
jgi:hypothetical protein